MSLIPPIYRYGAAAAIFVAAVAFTAATSHHYGAMGVQTKWDAQIAADAQNAADRRVEAAETNIKEVVRYVETIRTIPADPVIRDRIVRIACPAANPGVPSGSEPASGRTEPGPDAADLAGALAIARRNEARQQALINVVRQQLPEAP